MNSAWEEREGALYRRFQFKDFTEAFAFMMRVAEVAERMDHHPTWTNTYGLVEIWLSTHDAVGRITHRDHALAAAIDALLA
ncbi:MAG: 4a-hydroxytetrahydrobiopterin dehydratase [Flavobacteriales bacterium]|nr:4a-hydroxytetrahydrobiopterin dehydratase [Flavobacteriales bacterium]